MHSFTELLRSFEDHFSGRQFPDQPASLYDPAKYILQLGGKRVRPVAVLMGNELFDEILPDSYQVASAVELFHNFTLIHDDIMDKAPLRRGMETVHLKFGESTALLAGDVMLVQAYEFLNRIQATYLHKIIRIFNKTAREVCEGQQMDMDFEQRDHVMMEEYLSMIALKTSVLLGASLQLGSILGGAGEGNQQHLFAFGKNLGIAFQIQDDYLDAFGDPGKFGKLVGGDILANKKTFLLIQAMASAGPAQRSELEKLCKNNQVNDVEDPLKKVSKVLQIYSDCKVDEWARQLKQEYFGKAMKCLEEVAVLSVRKKSLAELAHDLLDREN